jgi:hypothetical protein
VKKSLIKDLDEVKDSGMARSCDVQLSTKLLRHDFVVVSEKEAAELRRVDAIQTAERRGAQFGFYEDRPVPKSMERH